ncbi:uncharacterized protein LOC124938480 [Impatiens glandulifera]|uniref:uncharacterized protein LOC124938480 n=1 Tax=Impatiens glandulifera TaxID=253017 RepID=UPI001FB189E5|nr:uncharacterized protein LOC124938480 [Impatiens glandulifera]
MKKRYLRSERRMMEDKDDKCLYLRLPKKKLQELCTRYGLSPYTNKANLVDSLFVYFKASGFNAHQIWKNESSSLEIVQTMESDRPNVQERVPLSKKRRNPHNISENNKKDGDCIMESSKFIYEDNNVASRRKVKANDRSPIEISPSKVPSKDIVPSFHFSVSCDEGINLSVDLNSNPYDWAKRLENETHYCHHPTQNKISGSFLAEVELIGNSNKVKDEFPRNSNFDGGDLFEDKRRLSSQLTVLSTSKDKMCLLPESSISAPSETKSSSEVIDSTGDAQFT